MRKGASGVVCIKVCNVAQRAGKVSKDEELVLFSVATAQAT